MIKKNPIVLQIAQERIARLFSLAAQRMKRKDAASIALSRRYLKIARNISTHYKAKLPNSIKNQICKGCGNLLVPGLNCIVRLASSKKYVVYRCECGQEKHIFYK